MIIKRRITTMKNTNKIFITNLIIALILFAALFAIQASLIANPNNQAVQGIIMIIYIVSFPIIGIFSLIPCLQFATLHRKNFSDYLKRMWLQMFIIFALTYGVLFSAGYLTLTIFGGLIEKIVGIGNVETVYIVVRFIVFLVYCAVLYKIISHFGFVNGKNKIYNFNFHIITVIYAFMLVIPNAIWESTHMTDLFVILNPHTVFSPNIDIYNEKFNAVQPICGLLAALAIEAVVFIFAYKMGKKALLKKHFKDGTYETDEK